MLRWCGRTFGSTKAVYEGPNTDNSEFDNATINRRRRICGVIKHYELVQTRQSMSMLKSRVSRVSLLVDMILITF